MRIMVNDVISYLQRILPADISQFPASLALPMYLNGLYDFFGLDIAGLRCIAAVNRDNEPLPPVQVKAHMSAIEKVAGMPAIYVCEALQAWSRERLIAQRAQFIVPGNQAYLPALGMDLREHYLRAAKHERANMSPAAELVMIALLQMLEMDLAAIAERITYTRMSVSRALDELEILRMIETETRNKVRYARRSMDRNQVLQQMPTPVKARFFVDNVPPGLSPIHAGLDALERKTMITANQPAFAINQSDRKLFNEELPSGKVEILVWRFNPAIFAEAGVVDPISLYLSLRDDPDERVQMALKDMMGMSHG